MASRWTETEAPRGNDYDARWTKLAAQGERVHGEADCVETLCAEFGLAPRIIDAGCGTGRVGIELAKRGFEVLGVDLDEAMLAAARTKAPELVWECSDLATWQLSPTTAPFSAAVLAGNVMIFVDPGTERDVLARLATNIVAGGLVIVGFQVRSDRLALSEYDAFASEVGLELVARYATWDRDLYRGGDYAVSVHQS